MNGSSLRLFRYRFVLLAFFGSTSDVAVASISDGAVVHGDTSAGHVRSACDITDVPVNFIEGESEVAKQMVMLQHDTIRSVGHSHTSPTDSPDLILTSEIVQNASAKTEGGTSVGEGDLLNISVKEGDPLKKADSELYSAYQGDLLKRPDSELYSASQGDLLMEPDSALYSASQGDLVKTPDPELHSASQEDLVKTPDSELHSASQGDLLKKPDPELHSASAPGSNVTSRTLALDATARVAVDGGRLHASHNETRKKKGHKVHRKREVTSWDNLPIFLALAAVPLLCMVTKGNAGNSAFNSDNDTGDYWDAQRSVGLHSLK